MDTMQTKRQSRPIEPDIEDSEELYTTRMPSSARRYRASHPALKEAAHNDPVSQPGTLIQKRRSSLNPQNSNGMISNAVIPNTDTLPSLKQFPLVPALIGVVITIVLFMIVTSLGSWWRTYQDDLHYGRPRTSQMDAVVGHNDSPSHPTHFIFINLHRHVEIIEIPGGDASHTRIYTGPILFGDGQDLTPITGEIRDVNGDKKPDLIVHIQDQQIVFLNDGTAFRPQ